MLTWLLLTSWLLEKKTFKFVFPLILSFDHTTLIIRPQDPCRLRHGFCFIETRQSVATKEIYDLWYINRLHVLLWSYCSRVKSVLSDYNATCSTLTISKTTQCSFLFIPSCFWSFLNYSEMIFYKVLKRNEWSSCITYV